MADHEQWKWQEPGRAWKGAGLYHITLTVTDRRPLLGTLTIPGNDPTKAYVNRTPFGNALVNCLMSIPAYHPEVQLLHFCLMPDHLHAVLYVRRTMPKGIGSVVRGFWQASRKLGRAFTAASSAVPPFFAPNDIRGEKQEGPSRDGRGENQEGPSRDSRGENQEGPNRDSRGENQEAQTCIEPLGLQADTARFEHFAASLRDDLGEDAYYALAPIFTEMPFIRPMGHRTQLPSTIRYIDMNPQRLATKRLMPGFFRVQRDITIGGRTYDGVGNIALLSAEHYRPVHVRSVTVAQAEHGEDLPLRDYMNGCVLVARRGAVMVSPFISPHEKRVQEVLLREHRPVILLVDNGFREYYKPADALFDACAAGRLLILSPWPYDAGKRHISRADCVALNGMAEEICNALDSAHTGGGDAT